MANAPPLLKESSKTKAQALIEQKDREDIIYLAKIAEQCERYEEMKEFMKHVTKLNMGSEPQLEERNLFSVAYKNLISQSRASFRILNESEKKVANMQPEDRDGSLNLRDLNSYRLKTEREIKDLSHELLNLVDEYCLPFCTSPESKVFYYKMRGDYYRYLCEVSGSSEDKENALSAYKAANDIASQELKAVDPTRLGLALNFSVFYYEILNSPDRACRLAKAAFDEALSEIDRLTETDYRDTTLIMQLLKDNLSLWWGSREEEEEAKYEVDKLASEGAVRNRHRGTPRTPRTQLENDESPVSKGLDENEVKFKETVSQDDSPAVESV